MYAINRVEIFREIFKFNEMLLVFSKFHRDFHDTHIYLANSPKHTNVRSLSSSTDKMIILSAMNIETNEKITIGLSTVLRFGRSLTDVRHNPIS